MADQLQEQLTNLAWSLKSHALVVADAIDRQADAAAMIIRESLSSSTWLPEAARPVPPPPKTPMKIIEKAVGSGGLVGWMKENKWAVALVVGSAVGIGGYVYSKKGKRGQKRRAKKAADGGRKEVVVLAGSPHDPISRSLALDMERRGFIVFVVVNSIEDEQIVMNEGRSDIKPLNIDILDTENAQTAIEKFNTYISTPTLSFPGAHPHRLHLSGVIILPDTTYPSGPVETIPIDFWADTLNLKILSTVVTVKSFLRTLCEFNSRLLILTPNVISPLTPPFHGPEATAVAALGSLATSLRRELAPVGVDVCHFKLGTFDTSNVVGNKSLHPLQLLNAARADILTWSPAARAAYAKNYAAQQSGRSIGSHGNGNSGMYKGSSLRELHLAVFDALTDVKPRAVRRVGSGSLVYEVLGRWAPDGLVGWMLNAGKGEETGATGLGWGGSASASEGSVEWEKI